MAKYTRLFEVKIEGQTEPFVVTSVSSGFADRFMARQQAILNGTESEKEKENALVENSIEFIAEALNRVGAEQWSVERLKAELDKQQLDAIFDKAMAASGLERPNLKTP